VLVRESVLKSDEAIVGVLGHEAHEITSLTKVFADHGWTLPMPKYRQQVASGFANTPHSKAVEYADQLVLRMRQTYAGAGRMETKDQIRQVLDWLDQGLIQRGELLAHAGLALADSGSAGDIARLSPWLKQELVEWACGFRESRTWLIVSNAGERDVSNEGARLLTLVERAGLLDELQG
jgi:hypothetical protein